MPHYTRLTWWTLNSNPAHWFQRRLPPTLFPLPSVHHLILGSSDNGSEVLLASSRAAIILKTHSNG